jgi:hypothetical protein
MEAIFFKTTGWREQPGEPPHRIWHNDIGDGLGLYYFGIAPDIPAPLESIDQLRQSYRLGLAEDNAGLVELTAIQLDTIPALKLIAKVAQGPHGMTYLGSFTIPRRDFSYVLKVQCREYGITGLREAVVFAQELERGHVHISKIGQDSRLINWDADPYEPTFAGPVLRNVADDERYDSQFPNHPLSRVRRYLNELESTVTIADAVKHSAAFLSPSRDADE